jgi:hypothetical protein
MAARWQQRRAAALQSGSGDGDGRAAGGLCQVYTFAAPSPGLPLCPKNREDYALPGTQHCSIDSGKHSTLLPPPSMQRAGGAAAPPQRRLPRAPCRRSRAAPRGRRRRRGGAGAAPRPGQAGFSGGAGARSALCAADGRRPRGVALPRRLPPPPAVRRCRAAAAAARPLRRRCRPPLLGAAVESAVGVGAGQPPGGAASAAGPRSPPLALLYPFQSTPDARFPRYTPP